MTWEASQFDYPVAVTRRFNQPLHAGSLQHRNDAIIAQVGTRQRGASVRLWVVFHANRVSQVRFEVYGCPYFIAATEMLAEWSEGRTLDELSQWPWHSVQDELMMPASKRGTLLVLQKALSIVVIAYGTTQVVPG